MEITAPLAFLVLEALILMGTEEEGKRIQRGGRDEGKRRELEGPPLTQFLRSSPGDSLRNDLYCVEWGVKLYSLTHSWRQLKYSINVNKYTIPILLGTR